MDNEPSGSGANNGEHPDPAETDKNQTALIASAQSFMDEYRAGQQDQHAQHNEDLFWHKATFWVVFVYSFLTLIIAMAGVGAAVYAGRGVREARRAADAAVIAAQAATRQVGLTSESERARFSPSAFELNKTKPDDPAPTIGYGFINVGRSPGTVLEFWKSCFPLKAGESVPTEPAYDAAKAFVADTGVVAGGIFSTTSKPATLPVCQFDRPITTDDYAAISTGAEVFLVIGYVKFRDIYGEIYTQRFAAAFQKDGTFHDMLEPSAYTTEVKQPIEAR